MEDKEKSHEHKEDAAKEHKHESHEHKKEHHEHKEHKHEAHEQKTENSEHKHESHEHKKEHHEHKEHHAHKAHKKPCCAIGDNATFWKWTTAILAIILIILLWNFYGGVDSNVVDNSDRIDTLSNSPDAQNNGDLTEPLDQIDNSLKNIEEKLDGGN